MTQPITARIFHPISARVRTPKPWFARLLGVAAAAAFVGSTAPVRAAPALAKDAPAKSDEPVKQGLTGEWPQWRGPNRDAKSTETGLLQKWPDKGPPLAWNATGLGAGFSGVAVADGKVCTIGDLQDASYIFALSEKDGKLLWSAKLGQSGNERGGKSYPGTRGTPTIDGEHVYALGQLGDLACVAAADGKEVWHKNLLKDFGGTLPEWNYAESVLVDGDRLVCSPGGKQGTMIALNKKTGEELWRSKEWTDEVHYSSAIIAEIGGVRQYIQLTPKSVAGIEAETGKRLWMIGVEGRIAVIPTPIYHDGYVYITRDYNVGCDLIKVTASGGDFKAERIYANKEMQNKIGNVILLDGFVYGHSEGKGWMCQNFLTGERAWADKTEAAGMGAIAYADGHFYLREDNGPGTVILIEASSKAYKKISQFNQPDRSNRNSWGPPVIAGGKLYLRDQGVLLCYNIKANAAK